MPTGAAIGLLENSLFEVKEICLGEGDTLVFYTDGLIDAGILTGESFGDERLRDFLRKNNGLPANTLMRGLLQELQGFAGNAAPADDTTIVVVRRVHSSHG